MHKKCKEILLELEQEEKIKVWWNFEFPKPFDNGLRLKDLLQDEVEEKYYINNDRVDELLSRLKDGKLGHYPNVGAEPLSSSALSSREHRASGWSENIGTLCARDYKDPKVIAEPQIVAERGRYREDGKIEQQLEVQESGNSNALTTVQKDNLVLEKTNGLQFVGGIDEKDWANDGKKYSRNYPQGNRVYDVNGIACSQTAQGGGIGSVTGLYLEETNEPKRLGGLFDNEGKKRQAGAVWDKEYIAPTVDTCQGGYREPSIVENPKVAVREATKKGYAIATVGDSINIAFPNSTTRRGRVWEGVAQTLETGCNQATLESDYKIRKLTPLECWRLMGFNDEDYWKARKALEVTYYNGGDRSNSQMYKMAGNSIAIPVLIEIYKNLFKEYIIKQI